MTTLLSELNTHCLAQEAKIEEWFNHELAKQYIPFYCSVDLRVCDYKIAPVDTNLFPGGFNNLAPQTYPNCAKAVQEIISTQWPNAKKIAIITEHHTRNPYYTQHLITLEKILSLANYAVKFAFFTQEASIVKSLHQEINIGTLKRENDQVLIDDFLSDLVILNNDQSSGTPAIIENIKQPVIPPVQAGWSHRRKSAHFFQYERIANRFAKEFKINPWQISAYFNVCNRVDISKNIGLNCLALAIEETLTDINSNYQDMQINDQAFVVLKADAGTYGMGVVMVDDANSVKNLNRKERKNLSVVKEGVSVNDILIQEGVETNIRVEGLVAEPVFYMIGTKVVGGFWRLNQNKSARENLNSKGMLFWPIKDTNRPNKNIIYISNIVSRLALLASAKELADEFARSLTT